VKNKFLIIISLICIITAFILIGKRESKTTSSQSVFMLVQEGIALSKEKSYREAIAKFNEASNLIKSTNYLLCQQDILNFNVLMNEFKTMQDPNYMALFDLLSDEIKKTINDFKTSKDINDIFKNEFCSSINTMLEAKSLKDGLKIDSASFLEREKIIISDLEAKISSDTLNNNDKNRTKILLNRYYLSEVFNKHFPSPVTEYDLAVNKAIAYNLMGSYDESIAILSKIINDKPYYYKSFILLSRNHESKGDLNKAISILEDAIKELPQDEKLLTELSALYVKANDTNKAREILKKAVSLNPGYELAEEDLEALDRKKESKLKSSDIYLKMLEAKPNDLIIMSNLAVSYLNEKKNDKADEILTAALKVYPEDVFLLKFKARTEASGNNYKDALVNLIKAKKNSQGNDPEIYVLLGVTYFNQDLSNDAYNTLLEGTNKFPEDPYLQLNMAKVCEGTPSHINESVKYYEKYLKLKPEAKNKVKIQKKINELNASQN